MSLAAINPTTGATVRTYEADDDAALERKLARAADAFRTWRTTPFAERARRMRNAATLLRERADRYGRLMAEEMGKPIGAGRSEATKCALACDWYADHAEALLADVPVDLGGPRSWVTHLPIGPVLAVMPWNFPFWQVVRFAAPNLMAGNVGLLKHASNVPQCALELEALFRDAGFPEGVFQTLLIGSGAVARVIDDPRVAAATLTGSLHAGQSVASAAGRRIKKTVLELGGSDPFIVMPSADLEEAARVAVKARVINNGQSCIAAKRFIVHAQVYAEFERRFVEGMRALKIGDPLDEETDIGPLATEKIRREIEEQVDDARQRGAKILCGGQALPGPGWFYEPTAIAEIPHDARVQREEVFGPVALLHRVDGIDEAIRLANDSVFGLGSSVWTRDEDEIARFVREIEAGMTFVNAMVASDPRLPFGGVKESGYGRELGADGLYEFVNRKSVSIAPRNDGSTE